MVTASCLGQDRLKSNVSTHLPDIQNTMKSLALFFALVVTVCSNSNKSLNISEPLTLTISPKIWNLLETKAGLITETVKSIKFPEREEKVKKLLKYKVWDGHFDQFSVPKTGVSFEDMNNGVHLRIKDVQFSGSVHVRLYIGGKLGRVRVSGEIKAKSSNAELDVILVWNDFSFTPTISMNSDIRVDFTHHLKDFNAIRSHVQKLITKGVNKKVPEKLAEVVNNQVNPRLQSLKQKLIAKGLSEYAIEWTIQNQILRVAIKPKSATGSVPPIKPTDKMLCVEVNIGDLAQRAKRSVLSSNIDVNCVDAVAKCEGKSCSYCTDIDINPTSANVLGDKFHNCIPGF